MDSYLLKNGDETANICDEFRPISGHSKIPSCELAGRLIIIQIFPLFLISKLKLDGRIVFRRMLPNLC